MKKMVTMCMMLAAVMGCTTTQKTAATGGLAGATLGGIIGHQSGDGVKGAAIGGVVGTVGGETYTEDVVYCPKHGVELKYREQ